jgi:hypothetical protein
VLRKHYNMAYGCDKTNEIHVLWMLVAYESYFSDAARVIIISCGKLKCRYVHQYRVRSSSDLVADSDCAR